MGDNLLIIVHVSAYQFSSTIQVEGPTVWVQWLIYILSSNNELEEMLSLQMKISWQGFKCGPPNRMPHLPSLCMKLADFYNSAL